MGKRDKKYKEALTKFDRNQGYELSDALDVVKNIAFAKFDETIEIHVKLGIDPRKSDQTVRGTTVLPNGTGKTPKVIVFTKGDKIAACEAAGADEVGGDELIQKVKDGFSDFDIAVASPDMMGAVGKSLGRVLGPKMPNPRAGTVSPDPAKAVQELKSGKIQYRADKSGIVHCPVGKVSFPTEHLVENLRVLLEAIVKARPSAAKGAYLRSVCLSSTMGPAVKVDSQKAAAFAGVR
ncbi:MAG: 50S ribosomal protein L1 [Vulcanimicrobiota bacterium]